MNRIEIFKAGTRRDANGIEVTITVEQLQQAIDAYDPDFHESPVVVGHPKHNHPAYAWVKALALKGDVLEAELDQIDPAFAEMVEQGRFKKVSASFYLENSPNNPKQGSLYLRHVGFLGAMPPAVKGLRNPEFAEGEEGVIDFTEWTQATLFRRLRDWLIGKFGQSEADSVLPDYLVSGLQTEAVHQSLQPEQGNIPAFNEQDLNPNPAPKGEPEMSNSEQAELDRLKAENEKLKADQAKAEAEKKTAELNATLNANAEFCEKLISQGKLAPVAKEAALQLLNCSATTAVGLEPEFNEGESMLTLTRTFLDAQPQVVAFGEIATKDKAAEQEVDSVSYAESDDPARIELDRKVRAYMKTHNCDYATALQAVL